MRLIFLFLIFPLTSFAISPSDVCKNVASKSVGEALRCNELISQDYFFDASAVFGCHKMSHWTAKGSVDCLVAIKNRIYPNQTAKACVELASYHFKAVECFQRSGRAYDDPNLCSDESLLYKINEAKSSLLNKNYRQTYRILTEIEAEVSSSLRK
ncbi:MAG: hypothetical protein MK008_14975 [Bdellovibrionales bacterium]|nr:hypothetical protein [Bdellovibrionales bacterium]